MRILNFVCLLLLFACLSCDQGSNGSGTGFFDYLLFIRGGGGDKSFTVQAIPTLGLVDICVSRYQFRDTVVRFQSGPDGISTDAFTALNNALHGNVIITGDFRQTTLPTGTWAFLYMVRNGERFEITNTDLRNKLLGFETLVEQHFPPPR